VGRQRRKVGGVAAFKGMEEIQVLPSTSGCVPCRIHSRIEDITIAVHLSKAYYRGRFECFKWLFGLSPTIFISSLSISITFGRDVVGLPCLSLIFGHFYPFTSDFTQ